MKPFFWKPLLPLIALLSGCGSSSPKTEEAVSPQQIEQISRVDKVLGVARIEPEAGLITLSAGTAGRIIQLHVKENGVVKRGQVLATLDVSTEEAQLAQVKSKLAAQQSNIKASEASLKAIKVSLENARRQYDYDKKLFEAKAQTRQKLDDAEAKVREKEEEKLQAFAQLEATRSKLGELQADIRFYEAALRQKQVLAPLSGKLLSLEVHEGDYLTNTTPLGDFRPEGALVAVTEVDELFADRVKPGLRGEIRSQSTGELLGSGEVVYTADYLKKKSLFEDENATEDRRVREVHVRLEPSSRALIGARVDCTIYLN